jgi:hypothetical protein
MRTPPDSTISHQSVEDREQLPHARNQRHLLGLPGGEEAFIELPNERVVSGSDQGAHVEGGPHRSPASPYLPLATALAGVAVEGGDANQCAQSLVGELSQFGQLGKQSARKHRTDTGNTLEKSLVLLEDAAPLDGFIQVTICTGELFLEPLDVRPDALLERRGSHLEAVVFRGEHREDLAPPGKYVLQKLGFLVGDDARGGTDGGGEPSKDESIYLVSFRKSADGFGEVSRLAGVDDRDGDSASGDGSGGEALVTTGGLQNYQRRVCLFETREKFVYALLIIVENEGLTLEGALGQDVNVEGSLGNVDADVGFSFLFGTRQLVSPSSSCRPGLADTGLLSGARALALATVRAPPKSGRDDECLSAVLAKPGPRRNRSVAPSLAAL